MNEQSNVFDNLQPDGLPVRRIVEANEQFLRNYTLEIEQGSFRIAQLTIDAEVWEKPAGLPLVSVADYGGTDTPDRTIAHWKGDQDGIVQDLYFIAVKKATNTE